MKRRFEIENEEEDDPISQQWEAPTDEGFWYRCYNIARESKNKKNYWVFGKHGVVDKIVAKNDKEAIQILDEKINRYKQPDCDAQDNANKHGDRVILTDEELKLQKKIKLLRDFK